MGKGESPTYRNKHPENMGPNRGHLSAARCLFSSVLLEKKPSSSLRRENKQINLITPALQDHPAGANYPFFPRSPI